LGQSLSIENEYLHSSLKQIGDESRFILKDPHISQKNGEIYNSKW